MNALPRWAGPVVSVLVLLLVWAGAAAVAQSRLLPGPASVFAGIGEAAASGALATNLGATLLRTAAAFLLAMSFGTAIGYAMGRSAALDRVLDSWLVLLLNLPALVVIILAYVWFGLNEAAAIGAVAVNKLPNTIVVIREGARALDPALDDVATAYRFGPWRRLRHVVAPQLAPSLMAAARSGLSLVWKIVLVVELLGRPNGVGFELGTQFQLFDVRMLLAYALAFVGVMLLIENALVQPLERRANRWRLRPA
jgi:NitT/TauT family transport system permease protein